MRGVVHDSFHRNVVRENFIVRVQDGAAFGVNYLFVNVCFRSEPRVFVMLDCLKINQAKRKDAEQGDKNTAYQSATSSATWIHVAARGSLRVESLLRRLIAPEWRAAQSSNPKRGSFSDTLPSS